MSFDSLEAVCHHMITKKKLMNEFNFSSMKWHIVLEKPGLFDSTLIIYSYRYPVDRVSSVPPTQEKKEHNKNDREN